MNNIRRIPRSLGMTYLSIQYNKETDNNKKEKIKEKIQSNMIDQYVANGMMLNGIQIPIEQMSSYLDMNTVGLMRAMNKSLDRVSNLLKGDDGANITRVTFLNALKKSLEISESCKSQTLLLKASQDGQYRPYISGEVNRSLLNEVSALKPTIDLLKLVMDKTPTNTIIQISNNLEQNNQYITPLEAGKLIENNHLQSLLTNPELIAEEEGLDGLPEVGAKFQDLTKIGIRYNGSNKGDINLVD